MKVQARLPSRAGRRYAQRDGAPGAPLDLPRQHALVRGVDPDLIHVLLYRGGRLVPQMEYQNIYLGGTEAWAESDVDSIDTAIKLAMQHRKLNNVMTQYFFRARLSCDPLESIFFAESTPRTLDEAGAEGIVRRLFDRALLRRTDLPTTVFNLMLPRGVQLTADGHSSGRGLGGFHSSTHFRDRAGVRRTVYYSVTVYSERVGARERGLVAFDLPWKNAVATLYHDINEFRTDPDVNDAASSADEMLGWTTVDGYEVGDQPTFRRNIPFVFREVEAARTRRRIPVQFMYSNAVLGAEGPIERPRR